MEGVEERGADEDEDRAQHDRADNPPEQGAPLESRRDAEVREDEREDEEVVDRQRLLDQEAREVFACWLASLPEPKEHGEGEPEQGPADAPRHGAAKRYPLPAPTEGEQIDEQHGGDEARERHPHPELEIHAAASFVSEFTRLRRSLPPSARPAPPGPLGRR